MLYFDSRRNNLGYLLVSIQFICLFLIFVTGPLYPANPIFTIIYTMGFILGIWGILSMDKDTLNVPPDVRPKAKLTKSGPYAVIRHPMYLSLLLVSMPLVIAKPTVFRILVETTLVIDLLLKLNIEEKMLVEKLDGYKKYQNSTWKIIPFIY